MAQVPTRILANRTRGKPGIYFGRAFSKSLRVSNGPGAGQASGQPTPWEATHIFRTGVGLNPPAFPRPRCRLGCWPTEPVVSRTSLSDMRVSKSLRVSNGPGTDQASGQPNPWEAWHLVRTSVCLIPSACPTAQVPAMLLANQVPFRCAGLVVAQSFDWQKLGRQKYEPCGNMFCVLLRFRRSRGNKNSKQ